MRRGIRVQGVKHSPRSTVRDATTTDELVLVRWIIATNISPYIRVGVVWGEAHAAEGIRLVAPASAQYASYK
jgi:hypothetical protein